MYKMYNSYIVYEDGKVYSTKRNIFLKVRKDSWGYYYYTLYVNGIREHWFLHKLLATLFIPKVLGKDFVNHKDGNKENNALSNLEWVTVAENNKHARINKLNDISKSNKNRWKDDDFRSKTSKKMSESRIKNKTSSGRNNPRALVDLEYLGKTYTMTELSDILGISVSYLGKIKKILKAGSAEDIEKIHEKFKVYYIGNKS